ncbi:MAG: sarcosine oxidase subunit delta [Alphaproteobacteria bacterium]|nr:sarcosine oxidase subunit delta [Alphaproteobacteria bacterium]
MIRLDCPHCGPRDQTEFNYGGDGRIERPGDDASLTAWNDFVYTRDNPRGPHVELWQHTAGCRQWIKVARDTLTHEIIAVGTMGDDIEAKIADPDRGGVEA